MKDLRKCCGGKEVQAGLGQERSLYAGRMLDGLSVGKSLGLDGAVTRNEQTLE